MKKFNTAIITLACISLLLELELTMYHTLFML